MMNAIGAEECITPLWMRSYKNIMVSVLLPSKQLSYFGNYKNSFSFSPFSSDIQKPFAIMSFIKALLALFLRFCRASVQF